MLDLVDVLGTQGETVEPSDYYPDAYYRQPPEDSRPEETHRGASSEADPANRAMLIRHQGLAEHVHVQRVQAAEPRQAADWET